LNAPAESVPSFPGEMKNISKKVSLTGTSTFILTLFPLNRGGRRERKEKIAKRYYGCVAYLIPQTPFSYAGEGGFFVGYKSFSATGNDAANLERRISAVEMFSWCSARNPAPQDRQNSF